MKVKTAMNKTSKEIPDILKLYENLTFNVHSSIEELENIKDQYKSIKKYFENKITFDEFLIEVDGI